MKTNDGSGIVESIIHHIILELPVILKNVCVKLRDMPQIYFAILPLPASAPKNVKLNYLREIAMVSSPLKAKL